MTTPVYQVDPDLKHPRVDEFYLGFEPAMGGLLRFTASRIWRDRKNVVNSTIPSATWTAASVANTPTGQPIIGYRWADQAASETDFLITNVAGFNTRSRVAATAARAARQLPHAGRPHVRPAPGEGVSDRRDRVGIYADMLNLANASVITGIQTRYPSVTVTGIANPILGGAPGSVSAPRQINLGARWFF